MKSLIFGRNYGRIRSKLALNSSYFMYIVKNWPKNCDLNLP